MTLLIYEYLSYVIDNYFTARYEILTMKNYFIAYFGHPNFATKEEGGNYMQTYRAWMISVSPDLNYKETPLHNSFSVTSSDVTEKTTSKMSGYARATAVSIEAVLEVVKTCPHLQHGTMEVSEEMDMGM
jgi:hypothetical protein